MVMSKVNSSGRAINTSGQAAALVSLGTDSCTSMNVILFCFTAGIILLFRAYVRRRMSTLPRFLLVDGRFYFIVYLSKII